MRNQDIKNMIVEAGLKQWQIAELFGITDGNFCRKLRYELTEADRNKIIEIIDNLKNEHKQEV